MRVIRFILAVYVLAITLYPCGDPETCADEIKVGIAMVAHTDHSADETDICSPFCICSCCAAHMQLKGVATIVQSSPAHADVLLDHYLDRPEFQRLNSIWQPPRA